MTLEALTLEQHRRARLALQAIGRLGGLSTSERKRTAARRNVALAREAAARAREATAREATAPPLDPAVLARLSAQVSLLAAQVARYAQLHNAG
jgi:hypothetical protein